LGAMGLAVGYSRFLSNFAGMLIILSNL
jgi:hypothetical protein